MHLQFYVCCSGLMKKIILQYTKLAITCRERHRHILVLIMVQHNLIKEMDDFIDNIVTNNRKP